MSYYYYTSIHVKHLFDIVCKTTINELPYECLYWRHHLFHRWRIFGAKTRQQDVVVIKRQHVIVQMRPDDVITVSPATLERRTWRH